MLSVLLKGTTSELLAWFLQHLFYANYKLGIPILM